MRILADQNVPGSLVAALRRSGHDVSYVEEIAPGIPDTEVLRLADVENRLLLTFDVEFASEVWQRRSLLRCGMILLRLPAVKPQELTAIVLGLLASRDDLDRHLTIVKRQGIRFRILG